ncbi:hypothetical protein [Clostridium brassicae]|uniref:Uncharacterized protein n=1 Tax=Clostridium brassicae TaxID=2999072 RepID=A0ABT4D606_9CLOT|nr:hypothetical protein [Clostridium brassicae]MCY6957729.1 hypothetical protein [Clostridium brassicae]
MLELSNKTNNSKLLKKKMLSICLIAISYITVTVKIKELSSVRDSYVFGEKVAYFMGMIIGISVVPLVVSLAIVGLNKFIIKKGKVSFLSIFSIAMFIRCLAILILPLL